jgi:hypothetical protein
LVGGGTALLALGGCLLTEPLVPVERENSPPFLLSTTPGFDAVESVPVDPLADDNASVTFSIDVEDANNPEDLHVTWFADWQGPHDPPCGTGDLLRSVVMNRPGGSRDSRSDSVTFATQTLGCHKMEAEVCDGLPDQESPCQRGCASGEPLRVVWFICVHDALVAECMVPAGGCG